MFKKTLAIAAVAAVTCAGAAEARDQVQIKGSSTVLPFANVVVEQFGKAYAGKFKAPHLESGGSSAGLKEFCKGVGENFIDIANASRPIKDKEIKACAENGVTDIIEIRIGKDGVVFANPVDKPAFAFEPQHIYQALAAQVNMDGKLADNTHATWNQIDPSFPNQEILMFIPGEKHGTREVFEVRVLEPGCAETGAEDLFKAAGDKKAKGCAQVRKDGVSVDIDGDYTETLARVESNPNGIGVFGLSFYEENKDKVKVATMSGVEPSLETIQSGEYPVSRYLYFYVKTAHLGVIPGLEEYVDFFLSDQMTGPEGMLADKGLIPLSDAQMEEVRQGFAKRENIAAK
ncbi:substrate-binding domain-containing protein [Roseospirillum parvum]|uniref:Phosphate transport system substrate-binding protein n=1 Tax=Roseospirillum parvum TaxID=83401 RepID=A0A1G7X0E9_9PROT|nr:substrate-binding domain-containing protein [Roseospirillum parvum]SDG77659.1 phosphate transport system substrate-binding protein [Roseospirillum parvum]